MTYNGIWEGTVSPKSLKTPKKSKGDRPTNQPTDRPTDQPTDGLTKRGVKSRSTRIKIPLLKIASQNFSLNKHSKENMY